MEYKCPQCGISFERSEKAFKLRPITLCKSCATKKARIGRNQEIAEEKRKKTCLEKYGVDNPAKSNSVKAKQAATCLERYGAKSPLCFNENKSSIDFKKRGQTIKATMESKYGGCTYAS